MIEYALMVGFVAVAAGAALPGAASSISAVFSQVGSVVAASADSSGGDTLKQQQPIQISCRADGETGAQNYHPTRICDNF